MKDKLLFYNAYESFYKMAESSKSFKEYCCDAFGADFSQDGFSDINQINKMLNYIPKDGDVHILDVGCGNGKMLNYLQDHTGAYIHGFDYSESAIDFAISNINKKKSDFRVGIIGEIEYEANSFDLITSMDSMYFAKDMKGFVSQMKRWLKLNGVIFIGYQEGDIMPKTINSESTLIVQALKANNMTYEVYDITYETYTLLRKKRKSIIAHRNDLLLEGLQEWYDVVIGQTDCAEVSYEEYKNNNARYIIIARL